MILSRFGELGFPNAGDERWLLTAAVADFERADLD
jgi:hypothetical protein